MGPAGDALARDAARTKGIRVRHPRRASTTKLVRETEAETVAFVVCRAIGVETGTAAQDHVKLYQGDARLLLESLEHIQRAATGILDAMRTVEQTLPV